MSDLSDPGRRAHRPVGAARRRPEDDRPGTGVAVDQNALALLAREKDQGSRTAVKRLLEQLGVEEPDALTAFLDDAAQGADDRGGARQRRPELLGSRGRSRRARRPGGSPSATYDEDATAMGHFADRPDASWGLAC